MIWRFRLTTIPVLSYPLGMTNLLPMKELPLAYFTAVKGALVSEASTIWGGVPVTLQRIYNDAADVGIAIRSNYTGNVMRFALDREERTEDGIIAWHFTCVDLTCKIQHVTIFND